MLADSTTSAGPGSGGSRARAEVPRIAGAHAEGCGTTGPCSDVCGLGKHAGASASSRSRCAAGRYGNQNSRTTDQCHGPCVAGRYGNTGATSDK